LLSSASAEQSVDQKSDQGLSSSVAVDQSMSQQFVQGFDTDQRPVKHETSLRQRYCPQCLPIELDAQGLPEMLTKPDRNLVEPLELVG